MHVSMCVCIEKDRSACLFLTAGSHLTYLGAPAITIFTVANKLVDPESASKEGNCLDTHCTDCSYIGTLLQSSVEYTR